jgi:hypothetical protein
LPALDPLSVVAPPGCYFVVGDPAAPRFTRDGSFRLVDGELRTAGGEAVLGTVPGSATLTPLHIDPVDRALGRTAGLRIEGDGSFAYARTSLDPIGGERVVEPVQLGRVALARFPAGTAPRITGAATVAVPPGTPVSIGLPGDAGHGGLVTYSRDPGRVDITAGLERLHEAYLLFDAVRTAGKAHGEAEKTALDLVK